MKRLFLTLAVLLTLACDWADAGGCGRWSFGIGIGFPAFYPACGPCYGYYYRPYPVYVAPPPMIVQPAPIVQSPPVVYQSAPVQPTPVATTVESRHPEVQQN